MRVLQVHNQYRQPGGEDEVAASEAELLASNGYEIERFVVENPSERVATVRTLLRAPWNRSSAVELGIAAHAFRPDVIHVHNTWFRLSPAIFPVAHLQAPVVMTIHNYRLVCANAQLLRRGRPCRLCIDGSLWNGVIHSCYRDPLSSAIAVRTIATGRTRAWRDHVDLYLTLSEFASELLATTDIPRDRLMIKDNFVSSSRPRDYPAERSRDLLFVGRLSHEKGILQLLAQIGRIRQVGLSLRVIGDGPLAREARDALGTDYLGRMSKEQVNRQMIKARALVMPSLWYEGQPRSALEAFASGLPVMGSAIGALPELLGLQGSGWTFDPYSQWLTTIDQLASDSFVAQGSRMAHDLWEKRFGPARALSMLNDAYYRAIEQHTHHS